MQPVHAAMIIAVLAMGTIVQTLSSGARFSVHVVRWSEFGTMMFVVLDLFFLLDELPVKLV